MERQPPEITGLIVIKAWLEADATADEPRFRARMIFTDDLLTKQQTHKTVDDVDDVPAAVTEWLEAFRHQHRGADLKPRGPQAHNEDRGYCG